MRTEKAQIRLRIRAVWSGPSLSADRIIGYYRMFQWRANAWMRPCACTGWCESAHFAHVRRRLFRLSPPIFVRTYVEANCSCLFLGFVTLSWKKEIYIYKKKLKITCIFGCVLSFNRIRVFLFPTYSQTHNNGQGNVIMYLMFSGRKRSSKSIYFIVRYDGDTVHCMVTSLLGASLIHRQLSFRCSSVISIVYKQSAACTDSV